MKIRGAVHGDVDALRDQVVSLRSDRAELLEAYRGFEKTQSPDPDALTGADLHQYLVLRGGIRAEEGVIAWLDEVAAGWDGTDEPYLALPIPVVPPVESRVHQAAQPRGDGSMHTGLEDRARDTDRLAEYFAERARGGVG